MSQHQLRLTPDAGVTVQRARSRKPCFALGTQILTPLGDKLIQDLKVGDLVETLDHGALPIRAKGQRRFEATEDNAPIRFRAGVLNNEHDLCVTPQHRIRFAGWQADLLFGEGEVLVAAQDFVNGTTVTREIGATVSYAYLELDTHTIIFAERVPVESAQAPVPKNKAAQDQLVLAPLAAHEAQVLLKSYMKPAKATQQATPTT